MRAPAAPFGGRGSSTMRLDPRDSRWNRDGGSERFEGGETVGALKIVAIVLIAGGIIGLVYGGFTYTKSTHEAKLGPFEMSIKDKETVNIPVWAGVVAIVAGGVLLFVPSKS